MINPTIRFAIPVSGNRSVSTSLFNNSLLSQNASQSNPDLIFTMKKRVTIREIAEAAGVHFTTVGLALKGNPKVKAETRDKVQKIAKKMGYQPDPMLSALSSYRRSNQRKSYQSTIAWLNNWPKRHDLLENPEFYEYFQGARIRAQELGYTLDEFWLHEKATIKKVRLMNSWFFNI